MIKLILGFMVLFSFSIYAQVETDLKLDEEAIETNPLEVPEASAEAATPVAEEVTPAVASETDQEAAATPVAEEVTSAVVEEPVATAPPVEEFVAPAQTTPAITSAPNLQVEAEIEDTKKFNPRKSHWVSTFGFESTKYEVLPAPYEFNGKKDFSKRNQELWGMRLGFGGEIYLGAGFVTRSMVETYYVGTLFSRVLNGGAEDADIKFAYTKVTGQMLGADASQSLGFMFDFKTKNPFMGTMTYLSVEPYVEAGIGRAYAYNRTNYSYKLDVTDEAFKLRVRDDLLNARIGAGINLTSNQGFFLALKATVNRYEITNRKVDGYTQENGIGRTAINDSPKDAKIDPVVIYTLGGGYKF
jgi:hypothetical protein